DRLAEIVVQLQGCAIPASVLERDVLAVRVRDYRPQLLDQLISMGEVVWTGRGSLGNSDGRVALYLRSDATRLIREPEEPPTGEIHGRLREHLQGRGASFFRDLYYATGSGDEDAVLDALWDMVWAGEVTNDTFLPLRMLGPRSRRNLPPPVMRFGPPSPVRSIGCAPRVTTIQRSWRWRLPTRRVPTAPRSPGRSTNRGWPAPPAPMSCSTVASCDSTWSGVDGRCSPLAR